MKTKAFISTCLCFVLAIHTVGRAEDAADNRITQIVEKPKPEE